jgi:hypothetical protein
MLRDYLQVQWPVAASPTNLQDFPDSRHMRLSQSDWLRALPLSERPQQNLASGMARVVEVVVGKNMMNELDVVTGAGVMSWPELVMCWQVEFTQ